METRCHSSKRPCSPRPPEYLQNTDVRRRARAVAALASNSDCSSCPVRLQAASRDAAASSQQPSSRKAPAETPAAAVPENEPKKPAEYVGTAVCMGCHEEIYNNFIKRNPHRLLETDKKRKWDKKPASPVMVRVAITQRVLPRGHSEPGQTPRECRDETLPEVSPEYSYAGRSCNGRSCTRPGSVC